LPVSRLVFYGAQDAGFVVYGGWFVLRTMLAVLRRRCRACVTDLGKIATTALVHKNQDTKKPPDGGLMKVGKKAFRPFSGVQ
jgi:hypothetical protein